MAGKEPEDGKAKNAKLLPNKFNNKNDLEDDDEEDLEDEKNSGIIDDEGSGSGDSSKDGKHYYSC